jgi:hypothetical protein
MKYEPHKQRYGSSNLWEVEREVFIYHRARRENISGSKVCGMRQRMRTEKASIPRAGVGKGSIQGLRG